MTVPVSKGVVVACPCGEVYELKPEYAGRLLECPVCDRRLRAGHRPDAERPLTTGVDPAFDRDLFLLNERVFSITAKYEVLGQAGRPVLYVERPTYLVRTILAYILGVIAASIVMGWLANLVAPGGEAVQGVLRLVGWVLGVATFIVVSMSARPLRHVTVYRNDSRTETLLRVLQDQRFALLTRTYTVMSGAGEPVARLRKVYLHNFIRKRWDVETPAGTRTAIAVEDSIVLSLLRRVLGPFFGLLRTNFLITREDGEVLGEFNRKFTVFDRYVLDLTADVARTLDRRVALALGVMLDTGERH